MTTSLDEVDALLPLALSQPRTALATARAVLRGRPTARQASVAHQAVAIVERDLGHLAVAVRHASTALRWARSCDDDRVADVLATYGLTLVHAGRTTDGLRRLDEAVPLTAPAARPRLLLRQANALYHLGRYRESRTTIDAAIAGSHRDHDDLWEARGLNNRCVVNLALGEVAAADADAHAAERLFASLGQDLESAHSLHNRALAAHHRGDLPEALTLMDEVAARYAQIGVLPADLVIDHAATLLTAGLAGEARTMAQDALAGGDLPPIKRAELVLTAARAALALGDSGTAEVEARQAGRLFVAQSRPGWANRAQLLAMQAQYLTLGAADATADRPARVPGAGTALDPSIVRRRRARLLRDCADLVAALTQDGSLELPVALLLHGRVAHEAGQDGAAEASFETAAASRHTGPPLARAAAWGAAATLAGLRHDRRGLLHACRRGLDAVDEHRRVIGDLEMRALATGYGLELTSFALREMVRGRNARGLLWWAERWRATALDGTPAATGTDPDDPELSRDVAALRDVTRRSAAADDDSSLKREQGRLEAAVQRRYRHLHAVGSRTAGPDIPAMQAELGDTLALSVILVDGTVHGVRMAGGRLSLKAIGPYAVAAREAEFARFTLRRAAYGRRVDLEAAGARLEAALLGPFAGDLAARSVLVVPPASLLTAPVGLLPTFADAAVAVSPSLSSWTRGRTSAQHRPTDRPTDGPTDGPAPTPTRTALVTGPGLSTQQEEVTRLHRLHAESEVLSGDAATVAGALRLLDGARLGHIAAHGRFRADAPLFSTLTLADGPLMVHDLDRLVHPPLLMVLSACDAGGVRPIGADEALGLVSSLLAIGVRTVVASVVPVNDRATVAVMAAVHECVAAGGTLAEGLLAARRAARDPVAAATAAAFTAWGA